MARFLLAVLFLTVSMTNCFSQEEENNSILKNQVSSNIPYLIMGSANLSYERTLGKYFAIGLSGVNYGKVHKELNLETQGIDYSTNYEINPFGRWYMNGTQNKSHFLELFASINEGEEDGRIVRITNELGYGVYTYGIETTNNFGLGAGYGYRFLLANKKLVLEAQFSLRTNFNFEFFFFDAGIVRTGIRVGYRF